MSSHFAPEAAGVVAGAFLSGAMMSISMITNPVIRETNENASQVVNQWCRMYNLAHRIAPAMSISTCSMYALGIFGGRAGSVPWRVSALASALTVGMIPFTFIFMVPTNNLLFGAQDQFKAGKESAMSMSEAQRLVNKWTSLHVVRSLFPLAGAAVGVMGVLGVLDF